ncbi:hypothetical protein F2Q70_00015917 [Brassica cretica]|uniref:Uncharacterized protein n=1 Tax=Brassica cretica TaxID=69181 RepID=A0A8S9HWS3_BRACR|nr:hypothetical protein F2Q70_00015917 [Brassica cretica]
MEGRSTDEIDLTGVMDAIRSGDVRDWLWDDAEHDWRTDSSGWLVGDQVVSLCSWSCGDGWLSD